MSAGGGFGSSALIGRWPGFPRMTFRLVGVGGRPMGADYFFGGSSVFQGGRPKYAFFSGKSPPEKFCSRSRKGAGWVSASISISAETLPRSGQDQASHKSPSQ